MTDPQRTVAIVLAAGAGSRFGPSTQGAGKLQAELAGTPLLERVVGTLDAVGLAGTIVVVGPDSPGLARMAARHGAQVVVNPRPADGLSSSVRVGLAALTGDSVPGDSQPQPRPEAALIVLGDQPLTELGVIQAVLGAEVPAGRSLVVPRYSSGGGSNPVLVLAGAWPLAVALEGDRGFGPLIRSRPELVVEVDVRGDNPDVDTPADLAALDWGLRVRANREQAERVRESAPAADFYGSNTALFRADPRRTDDPVLDALLAHARSDDRWLDVGAGAGRYALALALRAREVIALDPSPAMLAVLRELALEHHVAHVRTIEARWPAIEAGEVPGRATLPELGRVDATLIAHVGYDIEAIGPFIAALEAVAQRECVAILNEVSPAAPASAFWPAIHGEARAELPALPRFLELLRARGRSPQVTTVERRPRVYPSRSDLRRWVRQQLFLAEGSPRDQHLADLVDRASVEVDGGIRLADQPDGVTGIVGWAP